MIAADTSSLVAFLQGDEGDDVRLLDEALRRRQVVLPAIVVCEMLSFPGRGSRIVQLICDLPRLDPRPGAWVRAGAMRRTLLARGLRARLADTPVQPVDKVTRHSNGDASRLNAPLRYAPGRSSLRIGRKTVRYSPSRASSAGRLATLDAHATSSTG